MNRKPINDKISEIRDKYGEIIDEKASPGAFNNYFIELGEQLVNKFPHLMFQQIVYLVMYIILLMSFLTSGKFKKMKYSGYLIV